MSNGISGYNGRINLYRQLEQFSGASPQKADEPARESAPAPAPAARASSLGSGLSEDESTMIRDYFPESEQMQLRLYGPNRKTESMNPNAVGRRLDLRG